MAAIIWNKGEYSLVEAWLMGVGSAADSGSPVLVPAGSGTVHNFGLGLGTRVGGVGSTKTDVMAQILEVGTSAANGYGRAQLKRDTTTDWANTTPQLSGSYFITANQKTFSFSGTPNPNGATLWFVAGSTSTNDDNCLFGADTAQTRNFSNGDTEKVTPTYKQT